MTLTEDEGTIRTKTISFVRRSDRGMMSGLWWRAQVAECPDIPRTSRTKRERVESEGERTDFGQESFPQRDSTATSSCQAKSLENAPTTSVP